MDGQFHAIEFDPSATADEVLKLVKAKIGLRDSAQGNKISSLPSLGYNKRQLISNLQLKPNAEHNVVFRHFLVKFDSFCPLSVPV